MTKIYLAYQFNEEQLTKERLTKILDDYFDFSSKKTNAEGWFKMVGICRSKGR